MGTNNSSGRKYLDVVAFVDKNERGDKMPRSMGYAWKRDDGNLGLKLHAVPCAGSGWDGCLLIQPMREDRERDEPRGQRSDDRRSGSDRR